MLGGVFRREEHRMMAHSNVEIGCSSLRTYTLPSSLYNVNDVISVAFLIRYTYVKWIYWMKLELCLIHQLFGPSCMEAIQYIEVFCLLGRYSRCISLTLCITHFFLSNAAPIMKCKGVYFLIIVHLIVIKKAGLFFE